MARTVVNVVDPLILRTTSPAASSESCPALTPRGTRIVQVPASTAWKYKMTMDIEILR